ncbi:MAG: hypothetical protein AAFX85_07395, partial [Pseudomonadota bacterium]
RCAETCMSTKALYVEDVRFDRLIFSRCFDAMTLDRQISLRCVASVDAGVEALRSSMPDLLFLDHRIPPYDSFAESLEVLVAAGFEGAAVIVSGLPTPSMYEAAAEGRPVHAVIDKRELNAAHLSGVIGPLLSRIPQETR